jgi:hypothetical protein
MPVGARAALFEQVESLRLHRIGRAAGDGWLADNLTRLGRRSTRRLYDELQGTVG